jgi:hypothetical protein
MVMLGYKAILRERITFFRDRVRGYFEEPTNKQDYEEFATLIEGNLFKDCTDHKSITWKLFSLIYYSKRKFSMSVDAMVDAMTDILVSANLHP